jgi:replicative DNA helicase
MSRKMSDNTNPAGKIPPQSIDAEMSLLGAILIDDQVLSDVSDKLKPFDFYDKRHTIIFDAMLLLYEKHKPVDLLTLSDELQGKGNLEVVGGSAYLTEITDYVPTSAHAGAYADMIRTKAIRRRLIKASAEIAELGYNEEKTVQELLEQAEADLFSVSDASLKQDLVSLEHILTESFDRIEELHRNKGSLRGTPTGYRDIDAKTAGLQKSDLIILAARPAMGKSTFVSNLAYNIATQAKKAVLFFSLEMSKEQFNIRTGNLSEDDFSKLSDAMGEMAEAPIYIDDTPGLSVLEMRTKARREAHNQPLGLIIVDYLQLMQGSGRSNDGNRVQEVSEISRGLKLIARELDVPVIALSQLSRSVENRHPQIPQLADLRESGSIEQDADIVMFLYREDYYNPDTENQHITDLIIAKHRNGPTGKIQLYFHPEQLRFMSLDRQADE